MSYLIAYVNSRIYVCDGSLLHTRLWVCRFGSIDVSVAVATEGGLITPIVKSADVKSVMEIGMDMKDLAGAICFMICHVCSCCLDLTWAYGKYTDMMLQTPSGSTLQAVHGKTSSSQKSSQAVPLRFPIWECLE